MTYGLEHVISKKDYASHKDILYKEVYFGNNTKELVECANENYKWNQGTLISIKKNLPNPFVVQVLRESKVSSIAFKAEYLECPYIIIKKKETPYYRPFTDWDEFISAYEEHSKNIEPNTKESILSKYGMWIKAKKQAYPKDKEYFSNISEIKELGIVLATRNLRGELVSTSDVAIDVDYVSWYFLVRDYLFLDGSPCGKIMKETVN